MIKYLSLLAWAIFLSLIANGLLVHGIAFAGPPYEDNEVDAKIEIVWPHDVNGQHQPSESAQYVNIEVYLFKKGTKEPVSCGFDAPVILHWAENRYGLTTLIPAHDDELRTRQKLGEKSMRKVNGLTIPVWLFNDIDVQEAIFNAHNQYYFFVEVKGVDYRTNVWAHGVDARTYMPQVQATRSTYGDKLTLADVYIDIVWPKDQAGNNRPVEEAPLANISIRLEQHGDNRKGPLTGADYDLQLWRALNDGYLIRDSSALPIRRNGAIRLNGTNEPWWDFNNVDVSDAQNAGNRIFFMVRSANILFHSTIWVHGADSRTYFPAKDIPTVACEE